MLCWTDDAWEDYLYWSSYDKKLLKRLHILIKDTLRSPHNGIGKPEPLRGELQGAWNRHIDATHRVIYTLRNDDVIILSARSHYGDK
ncbi:Txe/YoeB family addiction module toxin [Alloscardovia macacae]|uniref:Endoribonuclease YoeB n=1 Tax=Alloscardovia macacae TaxID=1160091 RepID=A0A1Y2ST07_9BIFI|nr:Txe/YoeB family addiction module toxin [Alloscardovia macacae]OTA25526.1 Txe/YoeB family addiction module toxin [Alloscardovia macacae]OTA28093.1 Txe/YoeB family addiction module toxin [Alloscardovia macacae]